MLFIRTKRDRILSILAANRRADERRSDYWQHGREVYRTSHSARREEKKIVLTQIEFKYTMIFLLFIFININRR
jgi:hypothetical protein